MFPSILNPEDDTKEVTMLHRITRAFGPALVALIALALTGATFTGAARAATVQDVIALGYSVHRVSGVAECVQWNSPGVKESASGFGASADFGCVNGPGYQDAIDSFVAGHAERRFTFEHPDAAAARDELGSKGYAVAVDYAAATLHVTGGCNIDATLGADAAKAYADAAATAAPCPAAPATTTTAATTTAPVITTASTTPTTTTTVTDTAAQIAALQAQLDALAKRVNAIEQANTAAWDTFTTLLGEGRPTYAAALGARSAGLNALYALGG